MESTARTVAGWSEERRLARVQKVRQANALRPKALQEKFYFSNRGREPWNKGKTCPQTSGENHWNYGNKMKPESIEKMRRSLMGKKQSPELIAKRFASRAGYRHSEETKAKIGRANSGANNGCWNGGITEYPTTYFKARDAIRARDGHRCVHCGSSGYGKRLDVHHIDYDKKNIAASNLVTLCHFCHGKTNHHRKQWQAYFDGAPQFQ